jgi:hypothetical protein
LSEALRAEDAPAVETKIPRFDENAHFGEVCGIDGVKYVQGKAFFSARKVFTGWAPESMVLAPLTPQQEADRQKRLRATKKFFGSKLAKHAEEALPHDVVTAQRENARAAAAEAGAE